MKIKALRNQVWDQVRIRVGFQVWFQVVLCYILVFRNSWFISPLNIMMSYNKSLSRLVKKNLFDFRLFFV